MGNHSRAFQITQGMITTTDIPLPNIVEVCMWPCDHLSGSQVPHYHAVHRYSSTAGTATVQQICCTSTAVQQVQLDTHRSATGVPTRGCCGYRPRRARDSCLLRLPLRAASLEHLPSAESAPGGPFVARYGRVPGGPPRFRNRRAGLMGRGRPLRLVVQARDVQ